MGLSQISNTEINMRKKRFLFSTFMALLLTFIGNAQKTYWAGIGISQYQNINFYTPEKQILNDEWYFRPLTAFSIGATYNLKKWENESFFLRYGVFLSRKGTNVGWNFGKDDTTFPFVRYWETRGRINDYVLSFPLSISLKNTGVYGGVNLHIIVAQQSVSTTYEAGMNESIEDTVNAPLTINNGTANIQSATNNIQYYNYYVTKKMSGIFSTEGQTDVNILQTGWHVGWEYSIKGKWTVQIEYNSSGTELKPFGKDKSWQLIGKIGVPITKDKE